jgi:hypothetical protein
MKIKPTFINFSISALLTLSAHASINYSSGYNGLSYYTETSGNTLVSYDWGADGNFYTMTSSGYPGISVDQHTSTDTNNIYSSTSNFVGASLVAIGDYIYFNDSDYSNNQNIWKYNTSSAASATLASNTYNYALFSYNGTLFITGAEGWGTNHIYYSTLDANGDLTNDPAEDLGETFGSSGPVGFDAEGNLYYAPGYNDLSIYRWTADEVAAAISDPTNNSLPTDSALWYSYSDDFADFSGATGMVVDENGDIILSLTNFSGPSEIVKFTTDEEDAFAGYETILTSDDRLGDLRIDGDEIYFASGNEVLLLVPEPSMASLIAGLCALTCLSRRHRN